MAQSHDIGKKGETLAAAYLKTKGYTILETNWRTGRLEIDIIARKANVLIIVEVKTRSTNAFGEPELFVKKIKQRMLARAAARYLATNSLDLEIRFDILAVILGSSGPQIRYIEDAFYLY